MKTLYCLLLALLLLFATDSYAAFPVMKKHADTAHAMPQTTASGGNVAATNKELKQKINIALKQLKHKQVPEDDDDTGHRSNKGAFGIVSAVLAGVGLLTLALAILLATPVVSPVLLLVGAVSAIMAIVFGAMGIGGPNHPLAVLGLVLGIIELVGLAAAVLIIWVVLSVMGAIF